MGAVVGRPRSSIHKVSAVAETAEKAVAGQNVKGDGSSVINALTEVQLDEFREAFNAFDKDGGGSIDRDELMDLFRSLGQSPTADEIDQMIAAADTDGNGTIDFFEFATLMAHMMQKHDSLEAQHDRLRHAFDIIDEDNSGVISMDEMKRVMLNLGEPMTQDDVEEILEKFDANGDGAIQYDEFVTGILEQKLLQPKHWGASGPPSLTPGEPHSAPSPVKRQTL